MNNLVNEYQNLIFKYPFLETAVNWLASNGLRIGLILVGAKVLRHMSMILVDKIVRRALKVRHFATKHEKKQREDTLISIVNATIRVFIWIMAALMILDQLGVNIGPLIAGAGVIGIAVGFGAQSLIADFVAGLFIITENQYRVGDVVEIGGVGGSVEAITMRTTVLRDLDGNQHHIPNGSVGISTNKSKGYSSINLNINVSYESDIEKVEKVINKVGEDLAKSPEWHKSIIEPMSFERINNFGDYAIEVKILGKVIPGKQWAVAGEFRKRIKKAFDKNNISIPIPQQVVYNKK